MKIVFSLIFLLVAAGIVYGLAFLHVIPTASLAKTPAGLSLLTELHLNPPVKPKAMAAVPIQIDPLDQEKQSIETQKMALAVEKNALDKKTSLADAAIAAAPPLIRETSPKLIEIYEEMDSDDLVAIFAKEPDSAVVSALAAMDSKKAAKALTAMPPDRAAKVTALMNQQPQPQVAPTSL
jgi:hypothetical protein